METVAITEPEYAKAQRVFETSAFHCVPVDPSEGALCRAVKAYGARHAIVGIQRYTGELYTTLGRGAVLARFGVGHEGIDQARATKAGVLCTNTPGVLVQSVAEHTISLLLAAARHTTGVAASMRRGEWSPLAGRELCGKRLAIIGCGTIGTAVARIAGTGFGMHVVGLAGRTGPTRPGLFQALTHDFAEVVDGADFVSLHIPATPANTHFINRERLALLPPSSWLINTARGAVLDESALHDALRVGRLAGAALDVFEREPYAPVAPGKDLRELANAVLTPHVGSNTDDANARMAERALRNIAFAQRGEFQSMDLLNRDVLGPLAGPGRGGE